MDPFTPDELQAVDRLWKSLPAGHVWTGWAAAGDAPREVWIIRTRAHWRRFPLRKLGSRYALYDETGQTVAIAETLAASLDRVESLPGFKGIAGDGQMPSD
ncbi:MAG: hypothetical protein AAFY85_02465 [Pseudomonadota bacterium]